MDVKQALIEIEQRLVNAAERGGEVANLANELLPLVSQVQKATGTSTQSVRPGDADGRQVEYRVEKSALGEALAEYRPGGNPLRCPKAVYEAVAAVLAEAKSPLSVTEIVRAVESKMGALPGEFQLRVVLRYWMSVEPPLLLRVRARYSAIAREALLGEADCLWA